VNIKSDIARPNPIRHTVINFKKLWHVKGSKDMKLLIQNIKRLLRIIVENIILLIGAYLFTFNLFNFKDGVYCDTEEGQRLSFNYSSNCIHPAVYYYYNNETITYLALGVILIILGLLIIKERNYKN